MWAKDSIWEAVVGTGHGKKWGKECAGVKEFDSSGINFLRVNQIMGHQFINNVLSRLPCM